MDKKLELIFTNEAGMGVTLSVEGPTYPADPVVIEQVMDNIILEDVFHSTGGKLVEKRAARFVERIVEDIELH